MGRYCLRGGRGKGGRAGDHLYGHWRGDRSFLSGIRFGGDSHGGSSQSVDDSFGESVPHPARDERGGYPGFGIQGEFCICVPS